MKKRKSKIKLVSENSGISEDGPITEEEVKLIYEQSQDEERRMEVICPEFNRLMEKVSKQAFTGDPWVSPAFEANSLYFSLLDARQNFFWHLGEMRKIMIRRAK